MNDSIKRIKEDAIKRVGQYWNCEDVYPCVKCPSKINGKLPYKYYKTPSCNEAMILHLIDRTIKVTESSIERTCTFSTYMGIGDFYPTCSECGYEADKYECDWSFDGSMNYSGKYCSNCGAKVVK